MNTSLARAYHFISVWWLCLLLIVALNILGTGAVSAHEIRPAALDLTEQTDGTVSVRWKQPILSGRVLKMEPVLPKQCAAPEQTNRRVTGDAIIERWDTKCTLDTGKITINGLDRTLTDVFVRIKRANGTERTQILRPASVSFTLNSSATSPAFDYLKIGAEHMLLGWDHLLFVLGLLLLTPIGKLFWVITAFTIGHSITLAIAALGLFSLPGEPVELLIALSIFFLAVEVARKWAGHTSITIRNPWIVAAAFGLLHGLGFAGALADIGLPKGSELLALLFFNLGVELGQIIFVGAVLAVIWLARRISLNQRQWIERPALYLVGGLGAYFTLTRIFI